MSRSKLERRRLEDVALGEIAQWTSWDQKLPARQRPPPGFCTYRINRRLKKMGRPRILQSRVAGCEASEAYNFAPAMATPSTQVSAPAEVYGMFTGVIDSAAVHRIADALAAASTNPTLKRVHIAFQSNGGGIGEGVAIYNLFRTVPFELILYNIGTVSSIGVIRLFGGEDTPGEYIRSVYDSVEGDVADYIPTVLVVERPPNRRLLSSERIW